MKELYAEIERVLPDGGAWCDATKACTLASLIVGLRPQVVVEIGVFLGGSLVPMLLAMKKIGVGRAIAIDPWARDASVVDQDGANAEWWSNLDHDGIYKRFMARLDLHELAGICTVARRPSDQCDPPESIGLLHVDGNHGVQAIRDIERFAPRIVPGGILVMDDLGWAGGHVSEARERARRMGFVDLYPLGTGAVMQLVAGSTSSP